MGNYILDRQYAPWVGQRLYINRCNYTSVLGPQASQGPYGTANIPLILSLSLFLYLCSSLTLHGLVPVRLTPFVRVFLSLAFISGFVYCLPIFSPREFCNKSGSDSAIKKAENWICTVAANLRRTMGLGNKIRIKKEEPALRIFRSEASLWICLSFTHSHSLTQILINSLSFSAFYHSK